MKYIRRVLPHLTLVLGLMTLTFFFIDRVNAGMAFMTSELSKWVFAALALFGIATSVFLVGSNWRDEARAAKRREKARLRERIERTSDAEMVETDLQEPRK